MIKYRLPYKSYDDADWLLTIDLPSYTGEPMTVSGVAGASGILMYDGGVDDQWDNPLINITLTSEMYNEGQIDVEELQLVEDRQCIVTLTRNSEIKFKGYLISDRMQRQFRAVPYNVQVSATSGLNLLSSIDYMGFGADLGARVPLNYFRRILCSSINLGLELPIRWTPTVEAVQAEISGDAFMNAPWSVNGEGFYATDIKTGDPIYANCGYILEGLTQALQCRIVQADGAWWFIGLKESLADVISYKECANVTGLPVVTEHTRASVQHIGTDYQFINNDAVLTVVPALSKVDVVYTHGQRDNILPNGGQDVWSLGTPLWWTWDSGLLVEQHEDITAQGGYAVSVKNINVDEKRYRLSNQLPIDANILYRRLTWGFSFMAVEGFAEDSNGFIDWTNNKIKASVKYTINDGGVVTEYYLNEFGYWGNKNTPANQQVVSTSWETSGNSFVIQFDQVKSFFEGDVVYIQFMRDGVLIGRTVVFNETMDVDNGTDYIVTQIQDGFTSSPNAWSVAINNTQNSPNNKAWTEKTFDYYRYLYFSQDRAKLNDAIAVNYRGASSLDVYIVDPGPLDETAITGVGMLSIEFFIKSGQRIVFDDIWMKVDNNFDVYSITNADTKNANEKEIELSISSAFSGFKVSNFMRRYNYSNVDWKYTDGTDVGSLTELYARAVMKSRYKPSMIFNGSISTRGKDWSFLDNYTIATLEDKKFIPLNPTYNTSKNEVYLIAIEDRSDDITMDVTHKGSQNNNEI